MSETEIKKLYRFVSNRRIVVEDGLLREIEGEVNGVWSFEAVPDFIDTVPGLEEEVVAATNLFLPF